MTFAAKYPRGRHTTLLTQYIHALAHTIILKVTADSCGSRREEGERMAPNVRGPDKQKRKRAAATFKQNATTQRKKHNNKLAAAAEGTARLDAFVGTRGTSQGEPKNTVPEAVDDADDAGNKVEARPYRNVSVSNAQAGDGTAARGSQHNTMCTIADAPWTSHTAGRVLAIGGASPIKSNDVAASDHRLHAAH